MKNRATAEYYPPRVMHTIMQLAKEGRLEDARIVTDKLLKQLHLHHGLHGIEFHTLEKKEDFEAVFYLIFMAYGAFRIESATILITDIANFPNGGSYNFTALIARRNEMLEYITTSAVFPDRMTELRQLSDTEVREDIYNMPIRPHHVNC